MDLFSIRDQIRADEQITATLVNEKGQVLGTLVVEDMLVAMHGHDVLDFYGDFTRNPDCPKNASTVGVAIDLGVAKFDGGMLVAKEHKGWREAKSLYHLDGARTGGVYWHAETLEMRDLQIDQMPTGENLDESIEILGSDGQPVSPLAAIAPNFPAGIATTAAAE